MVEWAIADEVQLQFVMPASPDHVLAAWKADPPEPFAGGGFQLKDESYNALVYESRYYDWPAKLNFAATLGVGLLFKGNWGSIFQLTARFDAEGPSGTKVTVVGTAHPNTRQQLAELADQHGGSVGLRTGV